MLPDNGYVCFRKQVDQFFVITFDKPHPRRIPDKDLKQSVVEPDHQQYGSGYFQTYDNGIAASDLMPNLVFSGKWIPLFGSMRFASDQINLERTPGGQLAVVTNSILISTKRTVPGWICRVRCSGCQIGVNLSRCSNFFHKYLF